MQCRIETNRFLQLTDTTFESPNLTLEKAKAQVRGGVFRKRANQRLISFQCLIDVSDCIVVTLRDGQLFTTTPATIPQESALCVLFLSPPLCDSNLRIQNLRCGR